MAWEFIFEWEMESKDRSPAGTQKDRSPSKIFFPAIEGKVSGAIGILLIFVSC